MKRLILVLMAAMAILAASATPASAGPPTNYSPVSEWNFTVQPSTVKFFGGVLDMDEHTSGVFVNTYVNNVQNPGFFASAPYGAQPTRSLCQDAGADATWCAITFGTSATWNHGFTWEPSLPAGLHNYRMIAQNYGPGGVSQVVFDHNVYRPGADNPFGSVDYVNIDYPGGSPQMRLTGWSLEADRQVNFPGQAVPIHVYIDGYFVGGFTDAEYRSDVQFAYPAYHYFAGFDYTFVNSPGISLGCAGASDTISVWALNTLSGANTLLYQQTTNC